MKKVTLNIPENELDFYMNMFKKFGLEISEDGIEIPEWQKQLAEKRKEEIPTEEEKVKAKSQK